MRRAWSIGREGRGSRFRLVGIALVIGAISGWAIWAGLAFMAVGLVLELRAGEDA